jgi:hypothetical protein
MRPPKPFSGTWWLALAASFCAGFLYEQLAHAQALPPPLVVRSCDTKPVASGFNACTASRWVVPIDAVYINVRRVNVVDSQWIKPVELIAGDKVFACENIAASVFGTCPKPLTGRTDNWLDAATVTWATQPPPSDPAKAMTVAWNAPTQTSPGDKPIRVGVDLVGYRVFLQTWACEGGQPSCPTPVYVHVGDTPNPRWTVTGEAVKYCFRVQGYNVNGVDGLISDEACFTELAPPPDPPLIPGKPTSIHIEVVVTQ